ncbi:MAG: futalosine hydrolase [Thermodesulfovibrionales bacterium]|nr:futalosine hydrolase [Thermodesulfovibrionales bacterium]
MNKLTGLISATEKESRAILKTLRRIKGKSLALPVYQGKIGKTNIIHIISGIGKTNAAYAATLLIEKFSPSAVINFGIGGAYPSANLRAGDIAIADKEIYGDEGLWLRDGFHKADEIGIPLLKKGRKKYFNEFPLDKELIKKATKIIPPHPPLAKGGWGDLKIKSGTFVTVSTATGTGRRAREIEKRFDAICENMEGAAVAHVCAMYGIPMLEIRGISNIVEDRDRSKWDVKTAAENCQKTVLTFLLSR